MANITWMTAGESHGKAIIGMIEGLPANLKIYEERIQLELRRRRKGYGRGKRMHIETDEAEIISGIRFGKTIGSPIAISIANQDWQNWQQEMALQKKTANISSPITVPRPGHADFAGSIKYNQQDVRNILERASARETVARVALGALAKQLLAHFKISIVSQVIQIKQAHTVKRLSTINSAQFERYLQLIEKSPVHCGDGDVAARMMCHIDEAKDTGDSVGGRFEVMALNVPIGLGSHIQWNRRLDGLIAQALMSIPAIKAVEIGAGVDHASVAGSMIHDEIFWNANDNKFYRQTNHAGGIEGGISNGEPIIVTATMKPIPTLMKPLQSVDLATKKAVSAHKERSDVCAVPAAAVVAEAMLALVLADQLCEKFGGDSIEEMTKHFLKSTINMIN